MLVPPQWFSPATDEHAPLSAGTTKELLKGPNRFGVHRNMTGISVLALGNENISPREINSVPDQSILFTRPHARVQCDFGQVLGVFPLNHSTKTRFLIHM